MNNNENNKKLLIWLVSVASIGVILFAGYFFIAGQDAQETAPEQASSNSNKSVLKPHEPQRHQHIDSERENQKAILISITMLKATEENEQGQPIFPPELSQLDGQRVLMRGFMAPYDDIRNMESFMLFATPIGCDFCAPPQNNEITLVRQKKGRWRYPFTFEPIEVSGTLHLWREESDKAVFKEISFFYLLEDAEYDIWKLSDEELNALRQPHW